MRRKAMETGREYVLYGFGFDVANGRCAERQWRQKTRLPFFGVVTTSPTGDAPKGNGDTEQLSTMDSTSFSSPTGDAPKGNGDVKQGFSVG